MYEYRRSEDPPRHSSRVAHPAPAVAAQHRPDSPGIVGAAAAAALAGLCRWRRAPVVQCLTLLQTIVNSRVLDYRIEHDFLLKGYRENTLQSCHRLHAPDKDTCNSAGRSLSMVLSASGRSISQHVGLRRILTLTIALQLDPSTFCRTSARETTGTSWVT